MNQTPIVEKQDPDTHHRQRTKSCSRPAEHEVKDFTESAGELVRLFLKRFRTNAEKFLKQFKGVFWSILELHWIKVVYITAFVCAVSEVISRMDVMEIFELKTRKTKVFKNLFNITTVLL